MCYCWKLENLKLVAVSTFHFQACWQWEWCRWWCVFITQWQKRSLPGWRKLPEPHLQCQKRGRRRSLRGWALRPASSRGRLQRDNAQQCGEQGNNVKCTWLDNKLTSYLSGLMTLRSVFHCFFVLFVFCDSLCFSSTPLNSIFVSGCISESEPANVQLRGPKRDPLPPMRSGKPHETWHECKS